MTPDIPLANGKVGDECSRKPKDGKNSKADFGNRATSGKPRYVKGGYAARQNREHIDLSDGPVYGAMLISDPGAKLCPPN